MLEVVDRGQPHDRPAPTSPCAATPRTRGGRLECHRPGHTGTVDRDLACCRRQRRYWQVDTHGTSGLGLSLLGYKVILVDGDLGGADLHLFFNQVSPPRSLSTFLTREVDELRDVLLPTPNENLRLACGGSELVGMANLSHGAKTKLIRHIRKLDADFVLIDLGAGSAYNTLDIFTLIENYGACSVKTTL